MDLLLIHHLITLHWKLAPKIGLKNYGTDNADALNFKNNNVTGKNTSFEYANHISNSKKDKQYIKKMFEANNQLHSGWWHF